MGSVNAIRLDSNSGSFGEAGGRKGAVEARQRQHVHDGLWSGTRRPDPLGDRTGELHFRGGIGLAADLVLQPLDSQPVGLRRAQDPRHEKAGQSVRRLGEHQERVAHRRRNEPFVTGQTEGQPV